MAESITQQILLELEVRGNTKLSSALSKYAKEIEDVAKKTLENKEVNKSAARQLRRLQDQLKDLGSTWKKAGVDVKDWNKGLRGNEVHLDRATKAIKNHIARLKDHANALKEDVIRTEKKRTEILKLQSQAIREDFIRTEKKRTEVLKAQSEAIKEDFIRTEKKRTSASSY